MGIPADIAQALRGWAKTVHTLTDDQVIPHARFADRSLGQEPGPRPALPYLLVDVLSHNTRQGFDEVPNDNRPVLYRSATARITAFGDDANDWLAILTGYTGLIEEPFTVMPIGGMQAVEFEVGDGWEQQHFQDFEVLYAIQVVDGQEPEAIPLERVDITYDINGEAETKQIDLP